MNTYRYEEQGHAIIDYLVDSGLLSYAGDMSDERLDLRHDAQLLCDHIYDFKHYLMYGYDEFLQSQYPTREMFLRCDGRLA